MPAVGAAQSEDPARFLIRPVNRRDAFALAPALPKRTAHRLSHQSSGLKPGAEAARRLCLAQGDLVFREADCELFGGQRGAAVSHPNA